MNISIKLHQTQDFLQAMAENTPDVSLAVGTARLAGDYDIQTAMRTADERMYKDKEAYYSRHPEERAFRMRK